MTGTTLYTRIGDLLPLTCLIVLGLLIGSAHGSKAAGVTWRPPYSNQLTSRMAGKRR